MSKRLLFVVCLVCACRRSEERSGTLTAAHTQTVLEPSSAPAGSQRPLDASAPHSVAPGVSSSASAVPRGRTFSSLAVGYASGLRLEADALTYCDDRGGRMLDLRSGVESARERSCNQQIERNRDCGNIDFIEAVREPGPDDIIDLKDGSSIPVNGHIHDCAFNAGVLLVATGLETVAIDVRTRRHKVKNKDGGDQVAINDTWLAWSDTLKVFAERR